jgi:cardiolipin synthase A/B
MIIPVNRHLHPHKDPRPGGTGRALPLLLLLAAWFAGCGTISDVNAVLHTDPLYLAAPRFVGPHGAVTTRQAERIIARLQEHQQVPSDILQRQIAFEQAISDVPLVLGNKVILLNNGAATYSAMLAAIRCAHDSINLEMFIFSGGPVGQTFADALIERQRHGVQVNIMYDSLGSITTPASFFDHMRQNGIAVVQYRPVNPLEAKLPWSLSHRNHRKMLIVDGRVAFTGGVNISEAYASGLHGSQRKAPLESWRDTDIEVEGPAVAEFQRLFIGEWNYGPLLASGESVKIPASNHSDRRLKASRSRASEHRSEQLDCCHRAVPELTCTFCTKIA